MTDRLVQKLAQMAVRRELRERRLSLTEALEILGDLDDAGDSIEAGRWHTFVMDAHARQDFRFTYELTRTEWAAVMHGRELPVWSLPEASRSNTRFAFGEYSTWARDAKPDPVGGAIYAERQAAMREGRIMTGPRGASVNFRSAKAPLINETPAELEAALDEKVRIIKTALAINGVIDAALARMDAKLANGEAVLPTADTFRMLERTINEIAATPSGALRPARFTDAGLIPRWGELLRAYEDVRSKVAPSRPSRAVELTRQLESVWDRDDTQTRALAEKIVGSPDPLPAELLTVERGLNGVVMGPGR